ncbi:MAG TPA: outer membrane beta-barrel protein [Mucilaginibacter sp.]|nr:outer membrane beta-barrel protein [Mucilaginibacter sp.]
MRRNIHLSATLFIILFLFIHGRAQAQGTIKGSITDEKNSPVRYASILLKKTIDSGVYKAVSSDDKGGFVLNNITDGSYFIEINLVGYEKYGRSGLKIGGTDSVIDMGVIVLMPAAKLLREVLVTAQRPLIEKEIDKTVVNVDQSITSKGTTALELVQKLPGVQMTSDGQITLNGRPGINVLIDGKPTYLSADDLASQLGSMPSSDIQKIEIMTNPSAKYDAAGTGGIINIIKKKNRSNGLNGNVTGSFGQGRYGRYNGGLVLNYKTDSYNVYLNNNYTYNKSLLGREVTTDIYNGSTLLTEQASANNDVTINRSYNTAAGLDLYLSKKTTLSISADISDRRSSDQTNSSMNIFDGNHNKTNNELFTATYTDKPVNYTAGLQLVNKIDTVGKELSFSADYSDYRYRPGQYNATILNDASGNFIDQSNVFLDQSRRLNIYGARADYVQPIAGNGKIEAGLKSSYVKTNNNSTFYNQVGGQNLVDSTQSDYNINTENINAAYFNFDRQYRKLTIEAGLRAEQTVMKGEQLFGGESVRQNYFQLFPTLFTNYKLNDQNTFNMQLGRRIERADYHELVPFRRPLTPTLYFEGNPNLKPHLSWHGEVSWAFKNSFFITAAFDLDKDYIRTLPYLDSNKITSTRIPTNIQGAHSWNVDISYNKELTKWWSTNSTVSFYQNSFNGEVNGFSLNNAGIVSVYLESDNSFMISDQLTAESDFEYDSKRQLVTSSYGAYSILSFGLKQQLFNKKASISINAHDVLQSEDHNGIDNYQNLVQNSNLHFYTRAVTLTFNYRFGSGKLNKIKSKSGSEDEQKRAGD